MGIKTETKKQRLETSTFPSIKSLQANDSQTIDEKPHNTIS
jgi:hypothetical protein